ncbi:Mobile element protein [Pseudomonas synxantha]|uniref:Mobile element protein n=1 Tax=Pseudomonas synxantha TaxID=47883 RepID=A0A3G7UEE3_9PSED|nr:Mobile element protein [Pseudomonas synxantha]
MQPTRRSYSKSFKAQVIQECAQPGASIASVALSHNLNANLIHKWIRLHARRKFFELHATTTSKLAEQALRYIRLLYEIESEARDLELDLRCRIRQEKAVPEMDMLHAWMSAQRNLVPEGSAISRALDYSLKRWAALSRYLDDGAVPIDNNWAENQIIPWALGRKNWLFAGSLRSGKPAAAVMSLIQSARLNCHDPYAYLKDVLRACRRNGRVRLRSCCRIGGNRFSYARQDARTHTFLELRVAP